MPDQQQPPPDLTQAVLREVGPRLRTARLKRSLTLEALAEITGISASTLSRMEAGKRAPNLELLIPVTRALRISLDDLLMRNAPDPRVQARTRRFGTSPSSTSRPRPRRSRRSR